MLSILPCNLLLLFVRSNCKIGSGLQIPSVHFLIFAIASFFQSLRLYEHRLLLLLEDSFLLLQLVCLMVLDDFHSRVLDGLSDQHLQNWFGLNIEVKQPLLLIIKLNGLVVAFLVGHKLGSAWLVDVEVPRNRAFIHHVVLIIQRNPVRVYGHWILELGLLLFDLVEACLLGHLFLLLCNLLLKLLLLL